MPSIIDQSVGLDPNGNPVYVGANYRQQIVPFSRFGTRKVAWYKVGRADTNNGGVMDMGIINTIVTAIQTQAEIVMVGAPYISDNWGKFMVAVFEDTANDGADTDIDGLTAEGAVGFNANSSTLQDVVRAALDDSGVIVQRFYLAGAPATDDSGYEGFSTDTKYREYDTKAQFLGGYTQD